MVNNIILPEDMVLFHVLPRLPAKSIGRFTSVCKQWYSYLTSPHFTEMHLHHIKKQNHTKLLLLPSTNTCNYFQTMDCEEPQLGLSPNRTLPFEAGRYGMSILSSLNGLICIGIKSLGEYNYTDIVLWNPLTGDHKRMFKENITVSGRAFGLYYDNEYKLLVVRGNGSDAYIYSWKSEKWQKIKSRVHTRLNFRKFGYLVDDNLYFLAEMNDYLIARFNTKTETFTKIATPSLRNVLQCCNLNLTAIRGCIHLCVVPKPNVNKKRKRLELWKMDEDGNCSKVLRYDRFLTLHHPWHQMNNGSWLTSTAWDGYVYEVNMRLHNPKKVCVYTTDNKLDIHQRGKFVESLVSLNPRTNLVFDQRISGFAKLQS